MTMQTATLQAMQNQVELFEATIRDHRQSLARIVATYERIPAMQQELHQEILLAIWKALGNFNGESSIHTFIYRVAHNQAISHVSKYARKHRHENLETAMVDDASDPMQHVVQSQRVNRLFNAMHRLPLLQRELLSLSLEGLSYKELAEVTGMSESNVGVRLNRAKKALKSIMESDYGR
ncbi:MAG: sigma-70 family RNA polymerase sigma factor [Enterobacterales bacterium]|nr:sigma-70 family RNA polymerase sigma factor [Enterobacterales bacterium]